MDNLPVHKVAGVKSAIESAGVLAQRGVMLGSMATKHPNPRNGAPRVEKVWSDASSCAPHVDAGGPPTTTRNRASMVFMRMSGAKLI